MKERREIELNLEKAKILHEKYKRLKMINPKYTERYWQAKSELQVAQCSLNNKIKREKDAITRHKASFSNSTYKSGFGNWRRS